MPGDKMITAIRRFAFLLCLCLGFFQAAAAENISIATGGTGGVYYPIGGGIPSMMSKKVPGMEATAEVTGGPVDNLKLIDGDESYIGLITSEAPTERTEKGRGGYGGD